MINEEELKRRRIEAEEALDLFAELVGRVVIQHEMLNSEIRRAAEDALTVAEEAAGGSIIGKDVVERLLYKHLASEIRQNFVSILSSTFGRLTPGLKGLPEFLEWVDELSKMLSAENNLRNHIIHSEYFRDAHSSGIDEINGASLALQRRGRYSIRRFTREFLLNFLKFQNELIFSVMRLRDDINSGCDDLFEQAEIYAPNIEAMDERIERRHAGKASVKWLVVQYLGNEVLGTLRDTYQIAKIGELDIQYSDDDQAFDSLLRKFPSDWLNRESDHQS